MRHSCDSYYTHWRLEVSWCSCCFCDRALPLDTNTRGTTERINFRRAVQDFATEHNLVNVQFGKYKSATAELPTPCVHRAAQVIRLAVNYIR
jgi:hypothetical protein